MNDIMCRDHRLKRQSNIQRVVRELAINIQRSASLREQRPAMRIRNAARTIAVAKNKLKAFSLYFSEHGEYIDMHPMQQEP